ncbi:MAG: shikimate kinase, partial [Armatimonadetes bacterium]|nr:shikimate kinase [Armatimonadota bacterium]
ENVAALRAAGPLVCLTACPEVILARVGRREGRPLLSRAADPLAEIRRLLAERADRYALADLALDTSALTVEEVIERLCSALPSLSRVQNMR